MTLTKAELAQMLIEQQNFSRKDAKDCVENIFEIVREHLESGKNVKISGFGNFECREKSARPGRNFHTGETAVIPSRRVVVFKAGQKLKARLEELQPENTEN